MALTQEVKDLARQVSLASNIAAGSRLTEEQALEIAAILVSAGWENPAPSYSYVNEQAPTADLPPFPANDSHEHRYANIIPFGSVCQVCGEKEL